MPRAFLIALALSLPLSCLHAEDPVAWVDPAQPTEAAGRWTTMAHGYAFLVSNRQGGRLGERRFESVNHLMIISTRRWGQGSLSLLGTFTLEPATIPVEGSPELFQRGETFQNRLLVDRQHPHDLFVQLGAQWERSLSARTGVRIYLAPWGEPALGPTAYPHRLSASENPSAPLAHHNQDSTHISADVVTAGVRLSRFTVEGSAFHGAEPDENRWDIDQGGIDSYSGRVSFRPGGGFTLQISAGRRRHPEALEDGDQTRQTASVEYVRTTPGGFLAASLILGRNLLEDGSEERGDGLEATWKFRGSNFLYGRIEDVDRDLYELTFKSQRPETQPPSPTAVQAATLGYVKNLPLLREAETGFGGGLTVYRFDSALNGVYGKGPVSLQIFLRIRFGTHGGADHLHHGA
jgi:hypothetical protein